MNKLRVIFLLFLMTFVISSHALDLLKATIVYDRNDAPLVSSMAMTLAEDIYRVSGIKPSVSTDMVAGDKIILGTIGKSRFVDKVKAIEGKWECYDIKTGKHTITVTGSDARGLAYGVLHISERIGVNAWYWWADIPVARRPKVKYEENFTSKEPSVKYRGIFINDEDWGMKTWAAGNFEKELGDIGPKTYDKVCELILRLKGNMLAPAMHSCTGAFYSHPESQVAADKWGIMITTSHCEPMLINNAAHSEWNKARDGEWNFLTNRETILKKFDDRIAKTAQYDNIYTIGMRGLHDEAMKGSSDPKVRARTLEQVFDAQRNILAGHKRESVQNIPQIFVPYKEALDIYDAGLVVPDDVTLVWTDDNYGYMKRVSNDKERLRSGGSGVYYHLSYLGGPHDYLWMSTTAPALMYEELKKAYDAGADRYWLLNVGDIKPMEIEIQQFMDMAWDLDAFSYDNVNKYQAKWLASVFGEKYQMRFQHILDNYYRLAWDRKPEFMGYEREWDRGDYNNLHDTDFSFVSGTAQKRLDDYKDISDECHALMMELPDDMRIPFFEMLGYSVKSAFQINRKFLMAQRNHETGNMEYAKEAMSANDSIATLMREYNGVLGGKWNQMMSQLPPGWCAKYQLMPEQGDKPTDKYRLPDAQRYPEFENKINIRNIKVDAPFRVFDGIGTDWTVLQLGNPMDKVQEPGILGNDKVDLEFEAEGKSVTLCISVVPVWPIGYERSNRMGVSVDGCTPVICENRFSEYGESWKSQVLENRKEFVVTLPLDSLHKAHTLSLHIVDPGQMVQKITYRVNETKRLEEKDMAGYLMVYFKEHGHNVYFAVSRDGYTFTDVNNGEPVMRGDTISLQKGIRDPHIYRGPDNAFYMSLTDLHIYAKQEGLRDTEWEREGFGWGNNRALVLMKSKDLIHWKRTNLRIDKAFPGLENIGCAWAPATVYDEERGQLMLTFTMRFGDGTNNLYYSYVSNDYDTLLTRPQQLFEYPGNKSCIDSDITRIGNKYHLYYVSHDGVSGVKHAVSDRACGDYNYEPSWCDPEAGACEAPTLWKRMGQDKYVVMYDVFSARPNNMGFSETTDFKNYTDIGHFNGGCMKTANFVSPKHGAVVTITADELSRLEKYWKFKL